MSVNEVVFKFISDNINICFVMRKTVSRRAIINKGSFVSLQVCYFLLKLVTLRYLFRDSWNQ